MRQFLFALVLLVTIAAGSSAAQVDALLESLNPVGHVNDFAGVTGAQRQPIESLLTELEQKTGAQVAVVTVTSLDGGNIDDFAVRLFERWGIGGAEEDNGVLFIAAIEDRTMRIEVGYGLEPIINDALAGRIRDQAVIPFFSDQGGNDYASGLASGAAAIAGVIADEAGVELTGAAAVQVQRREDNGSPIGGVFRLLILLLLLPILWRNPWLALLLLSGGRGGGGGGFGRGGGGGFGGFGGGMSGGGGASGSW